MDASPSPQPEPGAADEGRALLTEAIEMAESVANWMVLAGVATAIFNWPLVFWGLSPLQVAGVFAGGFASLGSPSWLAWRALRRAEAGDLAALGRGLGLLGAGLALGIAAGVVFAFASFSLQRLVGGKLLMPFFLMSMWVALFGRRGLRYRRIRARQVDILDAIQPPTADNG